MLFPPERWHEEDKLLRAVKAGEPVRHFRTTRLNKDGRRIFASVSISPIHNAQGELVGFSKMVRDLTQELDQEQMLWKDVHYDALTGTLSRVGMQNAVDDLIRLAHVRNRSLALVYCNLLGFAEINHRWGTDFGNRVLMRVAQRLRETIREADDVGHLHADHFMVLLQGFSRLPSVAKTLAKLKHSLESLGSIDGTAVELKVNFGVAMYPDDGKSFMALYKFAEQDALSAKLKDPEGLAHITSPERDKLPENFFIVQGLNQAIDQQQLSLVYQPIVDARTGRPVKAEALLRWHHPELGLVSPALFIPLAEKYGLIQRISRWVLKQAVADLSRWTGLFGMGFQISVNRSSYDFQDVDESLQEMRDTLHEAGLCGQNLIVEVTEYSLVGSTQITERILKAYRALGVQVAMDDFGTGYSSLDYLKRYPVDYLKIDKSFVDSLEHNSVEYQLCESIVGIAKRLGLEVVAEGVETESQARILNSMGAHFHQGYHHARPMPAPAFEAYMRQALLTTPATRPVSGNARPPS